jgi:hypothetical protein
MSPTFRLGPEPAPLFRGETPAEAEADLTEDELEYLESLGDEPEAEWEDEEFEEDFEDDAEFEEATDDDAERVSASLGVPRTAQEDEYQAPRRRRFTPCFTAAEAAQTVRLYEENDIAGDADPPDVRMDRASCIVMLNTGLGQLLGLRTVAHPARGYNAQTMPRRPRTLQMGALSVHTVDSALNQLVRQGRATGPVVFNFLDKRGRRAGTLPPESMRGSVLDTVVRRSPDGGCWYAFGLSLLDATHSVLLLVDFTGPGRRVYWLDQNRRGLDLEVTANLDDVITTFTKDLWQIKLRDKKVRFNTTIRLWQLRKRV